MAFSRGFGLRLCHVISRDVGRQSGLRSLRDGIQTHERHEIGNRKRIRTRTHTKTCYGLVTLILASLLGAADLTMDLGAWSSYIVQSSLG